jgi:segregation and condensation protein A
MNTEPITDGVSTDIRVRLPVFEGPLDLLLYLIKKDELDIYNIPIERITSQYQEYLLAMKMMNLDIAGEFLVVASTLLYIKSRTLLPLDLQPPADEEDEDDPRWQLIRQLVEYKKFKDAAWTLQLKQIEQGKAYPRRSVLDHEARRVSVPGQVGVFDLITAFHAVLARVDAREDLREIFEEQFSVSDKIETIHKLLAARPRILFRDLFAGQSSRTEIVVTFLALLELIRLRQIRVVQEQPFAEIEIENGAAVLTEVPV